MPAMYRQMVPTNQTGCGSQAPRESSWLFMPTGTRGFRRHRRLQLLSLSGAFGRQMFPGLLCAVSQGIATDWYQISIGAVHSQRVSSSVWCLCTNLHALGQLMPNPRQCCHLALHDLENRGTTSGLGLPDSASISSPSKFRIWLEQQSRYWRPSFGQQICRISSCSLSSCKPCSWNS